MAKRGRPRKMSLPENMTPAPVKRGRGRPRKNPLSFVQSIRAALDDRTPETSNPLSPVPAAPKNSPPHLSHRDPHTFEAIWGNASALAATISDHYAMKASEQQAALRYALILDPEAILVELGVTHGRTAAILCYAAKLNGFTYYGVDNFLLEGSADEVDLNLDHLQLPHHILVGDTHKVPWKNPIDFLLIDAGHDTTNIVADCERWLPFVKAGGLVLFHDYNPNLDQADPHWGIKYAVDRYCAKWETIDFIEWLLVKQKPLT